MGSKSKHMLHSLSQSISFGMLSLKAKVLWPMIIADCDDQGRFVTDPRVMKWSICPNVDEITQEDIPGLLQEMVEQDMLLLYGDGGQYAQILHWWYYQQPRYARPSEYPEPEGWVDRINIRVDGEWYTENWNLEGGFCLSDEDSTMP